MCHEEQSLCDRWSGSWKQIPKYTQIIPLPSQPIAKFQPFSALNNVHINFFFKLKEKHVRGEFLFLLRNSSLLLLANTKLLFLLFRLRDWLARRIHSCLQTGCSLYKRHYSRDRSSTFAGQWRSSQRWDQNSIALCSGSPNFGSYIQIHFKLVGLILGNINFSSSLKTIRSSFNVL